MFTVAGRTFVWWKILLCFIVFSVLWLTGAGLLASRRLVRVHPILYLGGFATDPLSKRCDDAGYGIGRLCARRDGSFVSEVFSYEDSQHPHDYAQHNQCIRFKDLMDAVSWASLPPRFWNVTNVHW